MDEELKNTLSGLDQHETDEQELLEDENQAELEKELSQEELAKLEDEKKLLDKEFRLAVNRIFHQPTPNHSDKKRGVGVTRKNKEESKKARKTAKKSRRINRK